MIDEQSQLPDKGFKILHLQKRGIHLFQINRFLGFLRIAFTLLSFKSFVLLRDIMLDLIARLIENAFETRIFDPMDVERRRIQTLDYLKLIFDFFVIECCASLIAEPAGFFKRINKGCSVKLNFKIRSHGPVGPQHLAVGHAAVLKIGAAYLGIELFFKKIHKNIFVLLSHNHVVFRNAFVPCGNEESAALLAKIGELRDRGRNVSFLIGGSLGLSKEAVARADEELSLSKLTLPHRLARLVLLEQLYRSFKILNGETYHK